MAVETMTRKASDNQYLHKDFHCALNASLEYLRVNFGAAAVHEYLQKFAAAYHAPLTDALRQRGLPALREYFEKIYQIEGGTIHITGDENELRITVEKCPAVEHIRKSGQQPALMYDETARTVYATVCRDTPYAFELSNYDPLTGGGLLRFYRSAS